MTHALTFCLRALVSGALLLMFVLPADAQLARILRQTNLTPGDIELANGAAQVLFDRSSAAPGQRNSWQNPDTGAQGTVEVVRVEQGGNCISVRHVTQPKDKPQRVFTMRRCKGDGVWMLAP